MTKNLVSGDSKFPFYHWMQGIAQAVVGDADVYVVALSTVFSFHPPHQI